MTTTEKLIAGAIIFLAGTATGYVIGKHGNKKENGAEVKDTKVEEPAQIPEEKEEPVEEEAQEKVIDYRKYNKIIQENVYAAESEYPTDSDEDPGEDQKIDDNYIRSRCETTKEALEEDDAEAIRRAHEKWVEEHKNKIEPITRKEYESDFSESGYGQMTLYYFPKEDLLTDKDGIVIRYKEEWVGDLLDKTDYIRNNPKELDLFINKEYESVDDFDGLWSK